MTPTEPQPSPAGGGADADDPRRVRPYRRRALWIAVLAVVSAAALVLAEVERADAAGTAGVQSIGLLTAVLWVVFAARPEERRRRDHSGLRPAQWLPAVAIFVVACALRFQMLAYLPLPDRTAFEELQTGADAYKVLTTHVLPLEFRFTKIAASLGLWLGGGSLDALRLPFHLMGYASLAVILLCLRGLKVGWWPAAFVTVTAAASRWFVIGSGVAYEDFSSILFVLLAVWCLIEVDPARPSAAAWAGGAGIVAGVLMFENTSFRFAIVLACGWLVWLGLRDGRSSAAGRAGRWRPLAFFFVALLLVAAPMIVDVVHAGTHSLFFEAFTRYGRERSTFVAAAFLANVAKTFSTLAGRPVSISFYLAPELGHAVHPLVGVLLIFGLAAGLLCPRGAFVRAIALSVLLAILVCCAATNDFVATRIAPVFSLLLLTAGTLLEDVGTVFRRMLARLAGGEGRWRRLASSTAGAAVVYVALSVWVVEASTERVRAMAADHDVWNEYVNDQYVTAAYLRRTAKPGGRVRVFTPQGKRSWSPRSVAYWVYAPKALDVESVDAIPEPRTIPSGTLVVIAAEGRALTQAEIADLTTLGRRTGSLATLDVYRGRGGRPLAASICVGCGGLASVRAR